VKDLGSVEFEVREAASRNLMAAGMSALPAVAEAVESRDLETSERAILIFESLAAEADSHISDEAVATLRRMRTSKQRRVRQAAEIGLEE